MLGLFMAALLILSGCGDSGPDKVELNPVEKVIEVGQDLQFEAIAWSKQKALTDQPIEWRVEGDAGSIDETGRFRAQKPGQALIVAKAGEVTGEARVTVVAKKAVTTAESKKKTPFLQTDLSGLQAVILINNQDYETRKKEPVTFTHLKHVKEYGAVCIDCHHVYEKGRNVWQPGDSVKRCAECHDPEETVGKVMKLQNAYHRNCRDCHKKAVEEGKSEKAPYKKCSDCHEG
jgi:hypothetical protein